MAAKRLPKVELMAYEGMTDGELRETISGAANSDVLKAVMQMIDMLSVDMIDQAKNPKLSDKETHFALGGADGLFIVKATLLAYSKRKE